jgi:pyruvate,orthophosphate dikinase
VSNDGSSNKRVWLFREGKKELKDLLGGKGANLAEMTNIGLPVPPGFTITTETCNEYYKNNRRLPEGLMDEVKVALADVEGQMGKKFGDPGNPLLFSVRSGAKFSMPGMMDTVLNLGLNDQTLQGLISATGNPRFAYDSYRRFLMMFSDITMKMDYPGLSKEGFEHILTEHKAKLGKEQDTELTGEDWKELCDIYKRFFTEKTGHEFPNDPMSSCVSQLKPSSSRGTTSALLSIASRRRSITTSARRSTCRRWSSATWAKAPAPASLSRATRQRATTRSMAST